MSELLPYERKEIREEKLLRALPPEYRKDVSHPIEDELKRRSNEVVVYLEDDSTGVQKSHDVFMVIYPSEDGIRDGIIAARKTEHKLLFILTNSRGLPPKKTEEFNRSIVESLIKISNEENIELRLGSRGDSTLRGHFPLEPLTIKKSLEASGRVVDGIIISHAFLTEMARVTVNDIHLLRTQKNDGSIWYTPVHLTGFAQDPVFHYPTSNMKEYIKYKFAVSNLKIESKDIRHISIDDIRRGGPEKVSSMLLEMKNGHMITVDAVSRRDLDVFVLGLLWTEREGKYFIYRTAASFPPARVGMPDLPSLTREQILGNRKLDGGILSIWGSIGELSNKQLERMVKDVEGWISVELDVKRILESEEEREKVIASARNATEEALKHSKNAIVYTIPRSEYPLGDLNEEERTANHLKIANSLQQINDEINSPPSVLLFKGGTTSSIGLLRSGARKVYAMGQIDSGIPIVKILPDDNTRFQGRETLIILGPGNVGIADTYVEIIKKLLNNL
ncbi:MAG: hypothetical protein QG670_795 [Thermoproteota archaeon]|nr:hypothetical protein [Thermoproteota archaeon]